jgi:predicted dehydrogenase
MDRPDGEWHIEPFEPPELDDLFIAQANHFLNFVEGKCGPACSLEEGIQTLRVNLAALEAAEKQVWVEI